MPEELRIAYLVIAVAASLMAPVARGAEDEPQDLLQHAPFGTTADGASVERYTLRNRQGFEAQIITYGGIVTSLRTASRSGEFDDVVLGFDSLDGYLTDHAYIGALIGRYANRIAGGKFTLYGVSYVLERNDGASTLNGGRAGLDKVVWRVAAAEIGPKGPELTLTYLSRDGDEGFPGNLTVTARYTVTEDNALRLEFTATSDRDTVVNLSAHSYFNLRGTHQRGDVLQHVVTIDANRFTPVDANLIPTGELRSVVGTPFDFRMPTAIGGQIRADDQQLKFARGYDQNFVLGSPGILRLDATVYEPTSGRVLQVFSDQPGLQFYTGNRLDGTMTGKGGWTYGPRSGLCIEPEHFPDSPNRAAFPTTVLRPEQTYHSTIVYKFTTR